MQNQVAFKIYNASAGSGKTYTLTKEYLKIILQSDEPEPYRNILAITFTNKAVEEMKYRIVNTLEDFSKEEPSSKSKQMRDDIAKELNISAEKIQEKSRKLIQKIIHNYASFDISTIDKFSHRIIRSFAFELGLPMNFEVQLEVDRLLEEAVEGVIQKVGDNASQEDDQLSKLLIGFVKEKAKDNKSWNITKDIFDTSKILAKEGSRENVLSLEENTISDYIELKKLLQEIIEQERVNVLEKAQKALKIIEDNGVANAFYRNIIPDRLRKIIKEDGDLGDDVKVEKELTVYKRLDKDAPDFAGYTAKSNAGSEAIIEQIAPEILDLFKQIYKHARKVALCDSIYKSINPLSVLSTINAEFQKIQQDQNVVSISEFNTILNREIKDQPAPFIYEKLGDRYVHFFIDEFQDTSQMQWENLLPLLENALSGEVKANQPGTLMIVGDPKQSIYAWRGGKVDQFIELSDTKSQGSNPFSNPSRAVYNLDTNYRSYSQIIEFNNEFFEFLANKFENETYKKIYQQGIQKTTSRIGGYVEIVFLEKEDSSEPIEDEEMPSMADKYCVKTLEIIQNVIDKGYAYSDIAILVRTKSSGVLLADYLTEKEVPVVSSETLLLSNSDNIKLLIHLLYFTKDTKDQQSKAKFLYYLARLGNVADVHNFVQKGLNKNDIEGFEEWLSENGYPLKINKLQTKPLFEAVQMLVDLFFKEKSDVYLQSFQDLVLEQNIKAQLSLSDFLEYWEKTGINESIPSPKGNAVQIMTIHKSKGLEFPVVVMPFANQKYKKSDAHWFDFEGDRNEDAIKLSKIYITPNSKTKSIDWLGEATDKIDQEELLSTINVLYVALTRATEHLYVVADNNIKKDYLAYFFDDFLKNGKNKYYQEGLLVYSFGENKRYSTEDKAPEQALIIKEIAQKLQPENIKIAVNDAIMWNTRQKESIDYGNSLHKLLSEVAYPSEVDKVVKKAIAEGEIDAEMQQEVIALLKKVVNHSELTIFFAPTNKVFNERNIISQSQLHKPDRLVIDSHQRVSILDYKTGLENVAHIKQLERYAQVVAQMGFEIHRKSIVYIGEDIKIVEVE